ncbi:ATP-binding protein [Arthrobacter agilis]|uniref:ATP-binding protein n=1 Tax=Arthrobacter agilis TaxID=37921 RepID=UPI0027828C15|nr:ATP-binding protein [Arthrobacter agilis]MDQ0735865.1 two-component system sensor histidine kinase KdpD [Arthrobacter agilis]
MVATARRTLAAPVSRPRVIAGCAVALILPPLLEVGVFMAGNSLLAVDVLFQLAGVIAVALIGGLWPALLAALWSSIILNYTSTEPFGSLEISDAENVLTVLIFITVATTVSLVVGLSARRSREAVLAQQEAALLGELARGALAEEDTLQGFLRHVQAQFDVEAVALFGPAEPQDAGPAGTPSRAAVRERKALAVRALPRPADTPGGSRRPDTVPPGREQGSERGPGRTPEQSPGQGVRPGVTQAVGAGAGAGAGAQEGSTPPDVWTVDTATVLEPVDGDFSLALYGHQLSARDRGLLTAFAGQLRSMLQRQELLASTRTNRRLVEGNVMRTAILRSVSHDLRTPLAGIKLAVSSLRRSDVSFSQEDEDELLETIEDYSDRLDALVNNLLDMSRISGDAVNAHVQPLKWTDVVGPALANVPEDRVRVSIPPNLPAIEADPGLLERVLANIVENAVKYAPDSLIEVTASIGGTGRALIDDFPASELRVIDHGQGVSRDDVATMFRPFQRLDDAPSGAGVGLGLAVAKGFTEVMGGVLDAEQTPGGGLTLVIRLPISTGAGR